MATARTATTVDPRTVPPLADRKQGRFSVLEAGLCALIVVAPLPFGSVGPGGRLTLELFAFALTAAWVFVAAREPVVLPPRSARLALIGLLGLALLQLIPVGAGAVRLLSPQAAALRDGLDPVPVETLSLSGSATASAVRTGAALVGIVLVATSVAAARGAGRLALAALVAAAFEGLYGLLVLASGHDRIWNVPKTAYLDSATGTFVNHNHFAGFLAATLPMGAGLVIMAARKAGARSPATSGWIAAVSTEGSKALLLALGVLTGAAGLMLSFSRAGTALGLAAIAATAAVALRGRKVYRIAAIGVLVAIAMVPLLDLGADRLAARYAASHEDYRAPGGRLDVARDTIRMIAAFPASGCGFGAFTEVFPSFAAPAIRLHYTHAHNDLLQLGAEGGLIALALLGVFLAAIAASLFKALRSGVDPVSTGAAFGLAALLIHGLVDFNFHIPANAAIAAVLAGVLFGGSWNGRS